MNEHQRRGKSRSGTETDNGGGGLNFFGPQILLCLPRGRPLVDTPWIIAATPPMVHSLLASTTPYPCPCPCPPIFVCLFGLLIFCHG
ncbi:hypothetical protein BDA96_07G036200 [Sorghum bicolor]|uniref:Uncharacterized protein n=2 Tax=Sorghum bicolor TaxID=4558 RepID=A0A921U8L9_SORBI|nr:hypothetical protein BDA96_07G036200 [Sorghum bicolor]OQU79850.1 hypothetical protein SORBI_3007G034550 [Sorghum bicolor]